MGWKAVPRVVGMSLLNTAYGRRGIQASRQFGAGFRLKARGLRGQPGGLGG